MNNKSVQFSGKKTIGILYWLGVCAIFLVCMASAINHNKTLRIAELECNIKDKNGNFFISEADIKNEVYKLNPMYKGSRVKDVQIQQIENNIKLNEYVENAEIIITPEGKMNIEILQKNPIARIHLDGRSYYLSEKWELMPATTKFSKRVIHILGYNEFIIYPKNKNDSVLQRNLQKLVNYCNKNEFWRVATDQIYLTKNKQVEMVLTFSNSIHKLGKMDKDIFYRMQKVINFHKNTLAKIDLNQYKELDYRYDQQVVGIKK